MKTTNGWLSYYFLLAKHYSRLASRRLFRLRKWLGRPNTRKQPYTIVLDDEKPCKPSEKILILFFLKNYWRTQPIEDLLRQTEIPEGFEISTDINCIPHASVVIFHVPEIRTLKGIPRFPGQLWIGWSEECEVHRPHQDFHDQFNLTITYKTDADVFDPYLPSLDELRRPPGPKLPGKFMTFFASNWDDYSGRAPYAARLMQYVPMHSFGKCLNNKKIINDQGIESKMELIANYRFDLAIENAIDPDYVTEKFYQPLIAGTIPVYLGAPNIADFAPGEHCFIDIRDFKSPKALARYLLYLEENEKAYEAYFEWKRKPFRKSFLDLAARVETDAFTRLFIKLREHLV